MLQEHVVLYLLMNAVEFWIGALKQCVLAPRKVGLIGHNLKLLELLVALEELSKTSAHLFNE